MMMLVIAQHTSVARILGHCCRCCCCRCYCDAAGFNDPLRTFNPIVPVDLYILERDLYLNLLTRLVFS